MEQPADIRPCPFCAHDKPIVVTIAGDPPVALGVGVSLAQRVLA